jgi:hypothetical protein
MVARLSNTLWVIELKEALHKKEAAWIPWTLCSGRRIG